MNAKIIIATHKKYRMPQDDCYLPVHVGAEGKTDEDGNPLNLGYAKDNTGDNISTKNANYCELTGLYWAWKNLDADYIGLAHYRRHFSLTKKSKDPFENILNKNELEDLLTKYDVIVPNKRHYYIESLYSHYAHTHFASHLDETYEIIKDLYPEYIEDYNKVLKRDWGYMFNMMVMKRELLDSYCTWLFNILFELEKRIDDGKVEDSKDLTYFHGRFYGRVSEIIFNVWLVHQMRIGKITKVKEVKCINMEKLDWNRKIRSFLMAKFFGKKYEGSF